MDLGSPVVRKLLREQPHVRPVSASITNVPTRRLWLAPLHLPWEPSTLPSEHTRAEGATPVCLRLSVILLPPAGRCWEGQAVIFRPHFSLEASGNIWSPATRYRCILGALGRAQPHLRASVFSCKVELLAVLGAPGSFPPGVWSQNEKEL